MSTETLSKSNNKDITEYEPQILQRAEVALRCAPFTTKLFADMATQGVNLRAIAGNDGIKNQYLTNPTS